MFAGARVQRGHGLGSIFSAIGRFALPILRRVAPIVGRKILKTGAEILGDVAAGQAFKTAAKTRVVDRVSEGINKFVAGEENQSGSGKRRRKVSKNKQRKRRQSKKRRDIFS